MEVFLIVLAIIVLLFFVYWLIAMTLFYRSERAKKLLLKNIIDRGSSEEFFKAMGKIHLKTLWSLLDYEIYYYCERIIGDFMAKEMTVTSFLNFFTAAKKMDNYYFQIFRQIAIKALAESRERQAGIFSYLVTSAYFNGEIDEENKDYLLDFFLNADSAIYRTGKIDLTILQEELEIEIRELESNFPAGDSCSRAVFHLRQMKEKFDEVVIS